MYALKNLNMKEPGFVAYALWAKEVRKTLMNAYPNFSKFLSFNILCISIISIYCIQVHHKSVNNLEICGSLYQLKIRA